MKFIFDFDDVLFHNTRKFKEHMYACLEKSGVKRREAEEYYLKTRTNQFWLKGMLAHFSAGHLYEEIMQASENLVNQELIELIKKIGKSNCYILSYGDKEFQLDKIERTQIAPLFREVIVVSDSKKETVEKICSIHKDEAILFIDDKPEHFANLDLSKYPNLKTILFDEKGLEKLQAEIKN